MERLYMGTWHWHFFSISYRFRYFSCIWTYLWITNSLCHKVALPNEIYSTLSLYLVPFSRYSTSKFLGFDLDFWPGHLGSTNFLPFERPYMTSYLTSMDTISLSRTVFEKFDFKISRVWPWPLTLKSHLGSSVICHLESSGVRKAIYDFLFDFYGHHLSISYRFRYIRLQSFKGLTSTFYP